jgi:putative hydrolase of the HAD superfamily
VADNSQYELSSLKAVIFDYGDVLCLPPTGAEIEASARILSISSDLYRVLWSRNRDLYDRGDMSPEAYWSKFAEDASRVLGTAQLQELNQRDVAMWSRPNSLMLAWLQDLRAASVKTAILSNMHATMIKHARQNFRWLDWLDWQTLSAEVRSIKPEPAIYEHCLQGLGVAATESLLIDDRDVNLVAARSMGIHGIRYKSMAQLRSDLQAGGFATLPPETGAPNAPSL